MTEMNKDNLGVWSEPFDFAVERERTVAYAAATNDGNPGTPRASWPRRCSRSCRCSRA